MAQLMRCLIDDISVVSSRAEYGRRMGLGAVVDFDEVILPAQGDQAAYTLGDALKGRDDCFEAVAPAPPPPVAPGTDHEE